MRKIIVFHKDLDGFVSAVLIAKYLDLYGGGRFSFRAITSSFLTRYLLHFIPQTITGDEKTLLVIADMSAGRRLAEKFSEIKRTRNIELWVIDHHYPNHLIAVADKSFWARVEANVVLLREIIENVYEKEIEDNYTLSLITYALLDDTSNIEPETLGWLYGFYIADKPTREISELARKVAYENYNVDQQVKSYWEKVREDFYREVERTRKRVIDVGEYRLLVGRTKYATQSIIMFYKDELSDKPLVIVRPSSNDLVYAVKIKWADKKFAREIVEKLEEAGIKVLNWGGRSSFSIEITPVTKEYVVSTLNPLVHPSPIYTRILRPLLYTR